MRISERRGLFASTNTPLPLFLLALPCALFLSSPVGSAAARPQTYPLALAPLLYVFAPSEGGAIPKNEESSVSEELKDLVKKKLRTDITSTKYSEIKKCTRDKNCEVVMLHAERNGNDVIVDLKLKLLPNSLDGHPGIEPGRCLVESGTTEKDCLEADLEIVAKALIQHCRQYHGGNP